MANRNDPFFSRLTKLFRSGPAIQRRVKGYDYKSYYDNQLVRGNLGYRGPFPFGRESSPFSVLGAYGILDRMARYCLSGDVLVATNTQQGFISMKDLAAEFEKPVTERKKHYTFSYEPNSNSIVLREILDAFKTKKDRLVEVHYDNGAVLRCTADHRIMLRDGTYREARYLQPGDAVMPFYRKTLKKYKNNNDYRVVYSPAEGWKGEHKIVGEYIRGTKILPEEMLHVHHKNFIGIDNEIDNLMILPAAEHLAYHSKLGTRHSIEKSKHWAQILNTKESCAMAKMKNGKYRKRKAEKAIRYPKCIQNGFLNPNADSEFTIEDIKKNWESGITLADLCTKCGVHQGKLLSRLQWAGYEGYSDFVRKCFNSKYLVNCPKPRFPSELPDIQSIYSFYRKGMTQTQIAKHFGFKTGYSILSALRKNGYNTWYDFTTTYQNNKVVRVVETDQIEDVYDLTVEGTHNFAVIDPKTMQPCGIVHNSEFAEMEYQPEIAAALNIFADETAAGDEKGKAFHLYSKNPEVKKALEELFYDILNIDFNLRPWTRNLVKYGDFFLYNEVIPDIGIVNVQPIPVNELEREEGFDQHDPYAVRYKWLTRGNRYLENWQVSHMRVLGNDLFLPYGTCHEKTTKILTEDGLKEIQHIKVGDRVVSFDLLSQQKVVSPVLGVKNSGYKPCFEIRTKHNFLRTSKEHQILVWDVSKNSFDYKSAGDLKVGDILAVNTTHSAKETTVSIDRSRPNEKNKNGYWNSSRHIPENVTPEFARLFGFLLGDGWISRNQVCFANGVDDRQNMFYADLLEKFTGKKPNASINKGTQTVASSKMLAVILQRMGFQGKATTKRIPSWVYKSSNECRKAFLQGMHDADGSSYIDKCKCVRHCFELSNYELIKDIKALAQMLGYKTGKISKRNPRNKQGGIFENGTLREFKQTSPSYMFYWFESQNKQIKKWSPSLKKNECYITEPIVSIESVGSHETYDIYVQDSNHNFYANGIVTHNSILEPARRIWRQLIMMEDSMLVYRVVRSPERRVFYIDVGNVAPNDVPSYMEAVKQTMRSRDVVDRTNGRMDQRYNPLSIDEDYFIPVRGGQTGTKIETLAGGQNATAVDDVKYLQQKLFAAIQVPKPYLNFDENLSAKASLAQQDVRFSRTVSVLQRVIISELNKMAMVHLYSKGFDGEDLIAFELKLSNPSTVAMQQKLEALSTKFEIAGKAKETKLVDQDWIQKKILDLTDDDIIRIEAGIRRDKIREVEIEAIAVKENLPEKDTTTGPFDPSNYVMSGGAVKKNPPLDEPIGGNANTPIQPKNITADMQAIATSGVSVAGQPSASPDAAPSGMPIKATPFLSAARHNKRRRVGMGGRSNLAIPDFKDMLSGTNKYLSDINDKETLNLKSQFTTISEDINLELDYKAPPVISRDMKNLMTKLDIYFEKNGGRKNKKLLTENDVNLNNLYEEQIFEMQSIGDEIVVNSYDQPEKQNVLKEQEEDKNDDLDLSILE